jgi:hypothetical protein
LKVYIELLEKSIFDAVDRVSESAMNPHITRELIASVGKLNHGENESIMGIKFNCKVNQLVE